MTKLPPPPPEVPLSRDVASLAPGFRRKLDRVMERMIEKGWTPVVLETVRTKARVEYLYQFGRMYDDDRGIVTNVADPFKGWHFFGVAADIGQRGHEDGTAPQQFYADLEQVAIEEDLTPGADWNRNGVHDEHFCDRPHVQWWCEGMHVTPSDNARAIYEQGGLAAVWHALGADV